MSKPTHIKIRARHEPYRRAGMQHSTVGKVIALADLSDKQIKQLQADPHLVVTEVTAAAVNDEQRNVERVATQLDAAGLAGAETAATAATAAAAVTASAPSAAQMTKPAAKAAKQAAKPAPKGKAK